MYSPGGRYCDTLMSYNSLLEGLLTKLHAMSCIYSNNVWFSLFVSNFLLNKIILCILELSVCVFLSSCFIQTSLTLSSFLELHGRGSIIIITMQAVRNQENRRPSERRWLWQSRACSGAKNRAPRIRIGGMSPSFQHIRPFKSSSATSIMASTPSALKRVTRNAIWRPSFIKHITWFLREKFLSHVIAFVNKACW